MKTVWTYALAAVIALATFGHLGECLADEAKGDSEFVPYSPSTHESVDGKRLATVAYGVIICLLFGYSLSVLFRQRQCELATLSLKKQIEDHLDNRKRTQQ